MFDWKTAILCFPLFRGSSALFSGLDFISRTPVKKIQIVEIHRALMLNFYLTHLTKIVQKLKHVFSAAGLKFIFKVRKS